MQDYKAIIEVVPYALQLGMQVIDSHDDGALFELAPADRFIGNPMLRAFHGGIICSFMECSMAATVMRLTKTQLPPSLITQTTSFLRSASADLPIRVRTEMTKTGMRVCGVSARAFQKEDEAHVAKCSSLYRVG